MRKLQSLNEAVQFNSSFKTAVNLYLSLNKKEKVLNYIPTKSSLQFIDEYLNAVIENREQATLLVGPYGKGKSHLLLVLLAILSLERDKENTKTVKEICRKFKQVEDIGARVAEKIDLIWNKKGKFLPVIINDSKGDLDQAFLMALNDALKRNHLMDVAPETYFSIAIERLDDWEKNYPDTYAKFKKEAKSYNRTIEDIRSGLSLYSRDDLKVFSDIYPKVTAGSLFNPLAVSDVLPLYKGISEKLVEEYGYSGIYIVFDEFTKYIESQDGKASGNNMKLLQSMCELATDSEQAQVFFTMVAHKSIKEYGNHLSIETINSFTGIEGRLIEKFFITSSKNNYELIKSAIIKDEELMEAIPGYDRLLGKTALEKYYVLPAFKTVFDKKAFDNIVLKGCYPMNPVAAYLLLNISEKVAQNERTLFTFISNDEPHSMARFVAEHEKDDPWTIGADLIYDYFSSLFKKDVNNEFVHSIWLSADYALKKAETDNQKRIIKALAIALIVNKDEEIPADEKYLPLSIGIDDGGQVIDELVQNEIIYKKASTNTYVFKTRAGSALKTEVKRQREIKGTNVNYSKALEDITGEHFIIPRRYNSDHMMTRYFRNEFMFADDFLSLNDSNAIVGDVNADGKVITLFSFTGIKQEDIKKHIANLASKKMLIVCPKKGIKIDKQLKDFEILQELRDNHSFTNSNEILNSELPLLEEDLVAEVEKVYQDIYLDDPDTRIFYFDGEKVKKCTTVEAGVNLICESLYYKSPRINNEIINRHTLSSAQTKKARATIIQAVLQNEAYDEKFYGGTNQEATLYRSLFIRTGLLGDSVEADPNLTEIIDRINAFVETCSDYKRSFSLLISDLVKEPYGMREAVIPVYLAHVLSNRKEDIVVYFEDTEMQMSQEIIVNICENPDDYSLFVSKVDLQKEKYIDSLNLLFEVEDNRNLTTNRIKNILICMQRWFRALPQVSRNVPYLEEYATNESSVQCMLEIRRQFQKIEINPYEILFVDIPEAFGTKGDYEKTFKLIDRSKTEFDDYFNWLEQKAVTGIFSVFDKRKKRDLYHVLKNWYENQSEQSKKGLFSSRITAFMSCIDKLNIYDDGETAKKIVKAVSDVYLEDWNEGAYEAFIQELDALKRDIESLKDDQDFGQMKLSFKGRNGDDIERLYDYVDESKGSVLRNILEDTLDEYSDLSVNERVSILLEMIEKIVR